MKVVIDIQDGIYAWLKDGYSDEFDRKRLVKAVQNGTPFTELIEDIKADIQKVIDEDEENCDFTDLYEALEIIDRHTGEGDKE